MARAQVSNVCRWSDHLKAVLVVAGVDDAYELRHEWVELDTIVATVGTHQGNRGRGPRHEAPRVADPYAQFGAKLVEHAPIRRDAFA
jgi:hypothetical protein